MAGRNGNVNFRHWVRPRTSQYSYLYDYRKNYYDDVIDYLDRRKSGMYRDVPRPQTWAERALRTYTQKLGTTENAIKARNDTDLIHKVQQSRVLHTVHTKLSHARHFTTFY
ncbi:UNVERIFIED_CONTAM: hypothetical protein PYX00_001357 [Menopon gallinae]|uniref:Flightin n=1 Tax=Menopon gallinae TaxID=328185 RepID=A0AAW2ICH7_9NEOP